MMLVFIGLAGLLGWIAGYYVGAVKEFRRWQPLAEKAQRTLQGQSDLIDKQKSLLEFRGRLLDARLQIDKRMENETV